MHFRILDQPNRVDPILCEMGNEQSTAAAGKDGHVVDPDSTAAETRIARQISLKQKTSGQKVSDVLGKMTPEEQQEESELVYLVMQQGSDKSS